MIKLNNVEKAVESVFACIKRTDEIQVQDGLQKYKKLHWRDDCADTINIKYMGVVKKVREELPIIFFSGICFEFGIPSIVIKEYLKIKHDTYFELYDILKESFDGKGTRKRAECLHTLVLTNLKFQGYEIP